MASKFSNAAAGVSATASKVTEKVAQSVTAATAQVSGMLAPIPALLQIIRFYTAHNSNTVLAYCGDRAPFESLTVKQLTQIHNGAVSLSGAGRKIVKGSTEAQALEVLNSDYPAIVQAMAAKIATGKRPRFAMVHQGYSPLRSPGQHALPPLYRFYDDSVKDGTIQPSNFVDTVKAAEAAKEIVSRGAIGGYLLGITAEVAANKLERPKAASAKRDNGALRASVFGSKFVGMPLKEGGTDDDDGE